MTDRALAVHREVVLEPVRDARLVPYLFLAFGPVLAAIVAGQPALVALGAPFLLALVHGLRRRGAVRVQARFTLDAAQVLEGDRVQGRVEVAWDGPMDAWLLHRLKGAYAEYGRADGEADAVHGRGVAELELPIGIRAAQWGLHSAGEIWIRLRSPLGLLTWQGRVLTCPSVRVLPPAEKLDRLLDPPRSRVAWGPHRSRRLGDGHEFAELRHYVPGDRIRDLNWAATARHGRPFVNRHHPELSGDVLLALDVTDDGSVESARVLSQSARLAWAIAQAHARGNDRVGLLGLGGSTHWLPPTSGRLARYRLLEALLRIGGEAADRVILPQDRGTLPPPGPLIIVLSTLHDPTTLEILARWRAHGRILAAVALSAGEAPRGDVAASSSAAWRLWEMELGARRRTLSELGIPVVPAPTDMPARPVVTALRRLGRAARLRRTGRR